MDTTRDDQPSRASWARRRRAPLAAFACVAALVAGAGAYTTVSAAPAEVYSGPAAFFGMQPQRIMDTRTGLNTALAPLMPDEERVLQVLSIGGAELVPPGATAVVLNVTAVHPTGDGWIAVYPWGDPPAPMVSNVNFLPGITEANQVTVALGEDSVGQAASIVFYNPAGVTDVVVDVFGYYGGVA